MIIIDAYFLLLKGFWISLLTETLFFDNILVIEDKTPVLSMTSSLIYEEKISLEIFRDLIFFLFLFGIEKGSLILPLSIEQISETKADVVGPGPAPSPCIVNFPIGVPSIITAFNNAISYNNRDEFSSLDDGPVGIYEKDELSLWGPW